MSDLVKCGRCGKETNKYSPICEYCSAPLEREAQKRPAAPEFKETVPGNQTVDERGKDLHADLGRYTTKKCPFCAEVIQADAIKCRYCGEFIKKPAGGAGWFKTLFFILVIGALAFAIFAAVFKFMPNILKISMAGPADNAKLSAELKKDPAKADYVKKYITVTDFGTLEEIDPNSSGSAKYFSGTVKNGGDKTVIKLTLAIYYFDKEGKQVAEGTISPILGTKDKPNSLKPSGSQEFKLPIINPNPDWSGRFKHKVSDIEFL